MLSSETAVSALKFEEVRDSSHVFGCIDFFTPFEVTYGTVDFSLQ